MEGHPRHENATLGSRLHVWVVKGGGKGPRHENATLGSRFHVWGAGNIPDTKNATMWSRSSCLGGGGWRKGWRDTPDMKNATLGSRFHVWGVGNIRDTKNATTWSRSSCSGGRVGNEATEHEKHAIRRVFFVFWWKGSCRYGKISE